MSLLHFAVAFDIISNKDDKIKKYIITLSQNSIAVMSFRDEMLNPS